MTILSGHGSRAPRPTCSSTRQATPATRVRYGRMNDNVHGSNGRLSTGGCCDSLTVCPLLHQLQLSLPQAPASLMARLRVRSAAGAAVLAPGALSSAPGAGPVLGAGGRGAGRRGGGGGNSDGAIFAIDKATRRSLLESVTYSHDPLRLTPKATRVGAPNTWRSSSLTSRMTPSDPPHAPCRCSSRR